MRVEAQANTRKETNPPLFTTAQTIHTDPNQVTVWDDMKPSKEFALPKESSVPLNPVLRRYAKAKIEAAVILLHSNPTG